MPATAEDYAWFLDFLRSPHAYCLTLARGITPRNFLERLAATPEPGCQGIEQLTGPCFDLWDTDGGARQFIGVTAVPGDAGLWALGMEINGFLGVTPSVIARVSAGTRVVSHFRNVNALSRFCWIEDSDVRLDFEPLSPGQREGSTPDALLELMRQAGFDVREDGDTRKPTESAFALAECLTGVRVTPELLQNSTYACGIVRLE